MCKYNNMEIKGSFTLKFKIIKYLLFSKILWISALLPMCDLCGCGGNGNESPLKLVNNDFNANNNNQLNILQDENSNLKKNNEQLKKNNEDLKQQLDNLKIDNNNQLNILQDENSNLKKNNEQLKKNVDSLNKEVTNLKKYNNDLLQEQSDISKGNQGEMLRLTEENGKLKVEIEKLNQKINESNIEHEKYKISTENQSKLKIRDLEAKNKKLELERNELAKLKDNYEKESVRFSSDLQKLKLEIMEKEQLIKEEKHKLSSALLENNGLKNNLEHLNFMIKDLEKKKSESENESNKYKEDILKLNSNIESLNSENKRLKEEKQKSQENEETIKQQLIKISELEEQVKNLKNENSKLEKEKHQCDIDIIKLNSEKGILTDSVKRSDEKMEGLKKRIEELKEDIKNKDGQIFQAKIASIGALSKYEKIEKVDNIGNLSCGDDVVFDLYYPDNTTLFGEVHFKINDNSNINDCNGEISNQTFRSMLENKMCVYCDNGSYKFPGINASFSVGENYSGPLHLGCKFKYCLRCIGTKMLMGAFTGK